MNTLGDVKKRARSLVGDPDGDFATDAYILPLIQQAYDEAINALTATCSPFITKLVVCPNVLQGTYTLQELQAPGQPLFGLRLPLQMEFKQVGFPETAYVFAKRMDILPNTSPANAPPTRGLVFEWRSYVLYITTLGFAVDLRVRGDFTPPPLVNDKDIIAIHPLMVPCLSYATAFLIGCERQNQNYQQTYGPRADQTLEDIESELVRSTQATTSRVGKMNRRGTGASGYFGTRT